MVTSKGIPMALLVLALWGVVLAGCESKAEIREVQGLVREVQGASLTQIQKLVVEDNEGRLWQFTAEESFVGFTPSHLREHSLLAEPVCWQSAQVGQIRTREDYYYEELRGSSLRVLL